MECTRQIFSALLILLTLHYTSSTYIGDAQQVDEPSKIGWLFSDASIKTKRVQRVLLDSRRDDGRIFEDDGNLPKIISGNCRDKLNRLCGNIDKNNDELMLLECIQTFKVCVYLKRKELIIFVLDI